MGVLAPFSLLFDFILPPRAEALLVRAARKDALAERIAPRLIEMSGLVCTGLIPYRDPLARAAVHEWKYRGNEKAAQLLSGLLTEYLLGFAEANDGATIVPVPLSEKRLRERGFNQCETIARRSLAALPDARISLDGALIARVRDTEHQARLSREDRVKNVAGAFTAAQNADQLRTYLLLDDVVTTGATMREAAESLRQAGARHILCISLAY